ncbi:MAG: hypothetical protein J5637_09080 [Prevotella sp.]|nr:hypothetical protein [Prevotella sp.]
MKREYKKPLTEIAMINASNFLDEYGDPTTDSEGDIPGNDPSILGNQGTFEEDEFMSSKSLWE